MLLMCGSAHDSFRLHRVSHVLLEKRTTHLRWHLLELRTGMLAHVVVRLLLLMRVLKLRRRPMRMVWRNGIA